MERNCATVTLCIGATLIEKLAGYQCGVDTGPLPFVPPSLPRFTLFLHPRFIHLFSCASLFPSSPCIAKVGRDLTQLVPTISNVGRGRVPRVLYRVVAPMANAVLDSSFTILHDAYSKARE